MEEYSPLGGMGASSMHEILAMSKKSIFYASSHEKTRNKTICMQIISSQVLDKV